MTPNRPVAAGATASAFAVHVVMRAVRARVLLSWAIGAPPLIAAALFVANNPDVDGTGAARLAGILGSTLIAADLAEKVAARRPPWAWARSLPWSARHRVAADASIFGVAALPAVAAAAAIKPASLPAVLAAIPAIAVVAAGVLRRERSGHTGSWGPVAAFGAFFALWAGAVGWSVVLALVLAPILFHEAVARERAMRPSTWEPRHYRAEGDPRSWRGG